MEDIMKNALFLFLVLLPGTVLGQIDLIDDFATTQTENGFRYLAFGDNRPVNITNPSTSVTDLTLALDGSIPNGSETFTGDVWVGNGDILPYVQNEDRGFLALHPESLSSGALAAAILFDVQTDGNYSIEGDFARANDFRNAGNGVDVGIYLNEDFSSPLFESSISSDHEVSIDNVFGGTGVSTFDFSADVEAGDRISFFVFADSQGLDAGFDVTALRGTVTAIPEPSYSLFLGLTGLATLVRRGRAKVAT